MTRNLTTRRPIETTSINNDRNTRSTQTRETRRADQDVFSQARRENYGRPHNRGHHNEDHNNWGEVNHHKHHSKHHKNHGHHGHHKHHGQYGNPYGGYGQYGNPYGQYGGFPPYGMGGQRPGFGNVLGGIFKGLLFGGVVGGIFGGLKKLFGR